MQHDFLSQQVIDDQKRNRLIRIFTHGTIFKSKADHSAALKRRKCVRLDFPAKVSGQFFDQGRNAWRYNISSLDPNLDQLTKGTKIVFGISGAGSKPVVIHTVFFQRCLGNHAIHPAFHQLFERICGKAVFILEPRIVFARNVQQYRFPALREPKVIKRTTLIRSDGVRQGVNLIAHKECPFCKIDRRVHRVFLQFLHFLPVSSAFPGTDPVQKGSQNRRTFRAGGETRRR